MDRNTERGDERSEERNGSHVGFFALKFAHDLVFCLLEVVLAFDNLPVEITELIALGCETLPSGVVGVLQFEVLQYRLENEYNVEIRMEQLPYEHVRWIENKDIDVAALSVTSDTKKVKDLHDRPLLLFTHPWSVQTALDRNEGLQLSEFGATEE